MKVLHRFVGSVTAVLVVLVAVLLLAGAATDQGWNEVTGIVARNRLAGGCAAVGMLCLLAVYGLSIPRRRRNKILSFRNDDGTVSMSTAAISDYICKLQAEFPSIVRMEPVVVPRRGTVDVTVEVRVKAGPQIHEICEVLQRRVRETMINGLGIAEIRRVEVRVNEISPEHKAD